MRRRLLLGIFRLTRYYAWFVLIAFLSLAILSLWFLRDLPIDSSLVRLLPKEDPIVQKILDRSEELESTEMVTILLRLTDSPSLESEKLRRLQSAGEAVQAVLIEKPEIEAVNLDKQTNFEPPINLLELDELEAQIADAEAQIDELATSIPEAPIDPDSEKTITDQYREVAEALEALFGNLAILDIEQAREALRQIDENIDTLKERNEQFLNYLNEQPERLPELREGVRSVDRFLNELPVGDPGLHDNHELNLSINKNSLVVRVQPSQSSQLGTNYNRRIIEDINQGLSTIDFAQYGVYFDGLTGPYVFSVESDEQLKQDTRRTALITIVGVLLLFFVVLKRYFYPLVATFPVLIALIFTIALAKLIFGGLNLVTAFLPAIILGLGIDYGIQFIVHYLEERQGSRRIGPALRTTLINKGSAMLSAATATSFVLFALGFIAKTVGLSEIGYILGFGVLLSCMLTLLVLPSLIFAASTVLRRRIRAHPPKPWNLTPLAKGVIKLRWLILAATAIGSIFMILPASQISFSFVSESLQPKNLDSTRVGNFIEQNFEERPNRGNAFAFFVPDSPESKEIATQLNNVEGVESVVSIYSWVEDPDDITRTQEILARLREISQELIRIISQIIPQLGTASEEFDRRDETVEQLNRIVEWLQKGEDDADNLSSGDIVQQELSELRTSTTAIIERLSELGEENLDQQLEDLLIDLNNLLPELQRLETQIPDPDEMRAIADELCENLCTTDPYTGEPNQIIYVLVDVDWLWDSDLYAELLGNFESIWTDFVGLPQIRIQLEGYMEDDFWKSTLIALLIITVILAIDFFTVKIWGATLFSLLALGLGYLWLLGIMTFRGIDFNVANILISPLLLGLGVDNCVYLLHRVRDIKSELPEGVELTTRELMTRALSSASVPVIANTFATMIAFGSLIFAETPVLRVLGESATWGIGFMTLFSLTFLPSIIALRR